MAKTVLTPHLVQTEDGGEVTIGLFIGDECLMQFSSEFANKLADALVIMSIKANRLNGKGIDPCTPTKLN